MNSEIIICNTEEGRAQINLQLDNGTVWLNRSETAELFQTSKQNISKHIKVIFANGELSEETTVNYKLTVKDEGDIRGQRQFVLYNLNMTLAIGYRVCFISRTQVRSEYKKYSGKTLTSVEKGYLKEIKRLEALTINGGCKNE